MTNSIAQGVAFFKTHPTRNGATWDQWCQSFVYRCLFVVNNKDTNGITATTAYKAYLYTKRLGQIFSTDASKAPQGAVHYWADSLANPGDGHIAWQHGKNKGKDSRIAMASRHIQTAYGVAEGTTTVEVYTKATGLVYLGWGTFMGVNFKGSDLEKQITKQAAAAKKAAAAKAKTPVKAAPVAAAPVSSDIAALRTANAKLQSELAAAKAAITEAKAVLNAVK